jgi:fatty acid desaturase
MSDPILTEDPRTLEPVHTGTKSTDNVWTARLVLFLRVMAGVSMLKGLYHWSLVTGIGVAPSDVFEAHATPWQTATVFFAVIDLIAAVGLWLAAAWGAVVWLTSVASMMAVEFLFPQIYASGMLISAVEAVLLGLYLWLALKSARERPI